MVTDLEIKWTWSVEYVEHLLHKLDMNKETGYDQIPPNIVKLYSKELSKT